MFTTVFNIAIIYFTQQQLKRTQIQQCSNQIINVYTVHVFCSKRITINNLIMNQNINYTPNQQYLTSQHHSILHETFKVQNLIVHSQISNNQANSISSLFSIFSYSNTLSLTQISLNLELTSTYSRASFLSLTLQDLKVVQSAFNFTGTSENISSLVDTLDFKAIINQVKLNINLAGKYASGLVMTLKPEATMTISNLKMFGVLTADVLAALITMSQSSSADIQGTICVQILGSSCSSCLQFSIATCCPSDSKIVKVNDYYTCSCNDITKTLLDPLAPGSTSCVCREDYFASYSSCSQCPADSTSAKNSASCSCSQQFQAHNTVNNTCDCTLSFSTKVNGICSCGQGASIQNNTCSCTLGAKRVGDYCICTIGATFIDNACVCPNGAILTAQGECKCPQFSTLVNNTEVYSCQCMDGGYISGTSCVCTTGATLAFGKCICSSGATLTGNICVCPTNSNLVLSGGSYICQCNSNMVLSGSSCICITNAYLSGSSCLCPTSAYISGGSCVCPTGATISGTSCICPTGAFVSGNTCQCPTYGSLVNASGIYSCKCGTNMVLSGNYCICIPNGYISGSSCVCPTSATVSGGACVCPAGTSVSGGSCVCTNGATLTAGKCDCPQGAIITGGQCTCPTYSKPIQNGSSQVCKCNENMILNGNTCDCIEHAVLSGTSCICANISRIVNGICECPLNFYFVQHYNSFVCERCD
ncbi:Conserved_hypothetical protein [Hexamita inflata]|uniref:Uncharacterized protein n=1 Tax=Hexamita inflata TaxID=28002 RepID=A0AA86S3E2_9EUKA|nr:Conserved hypothetical protein [Hexamita inflata]